MNRRMLVSIGLVLAIVVPAWAQPALPPPPPMPPAPPPVALPADAVPPLANRLPAQCMIYIGWVGMDASRPAVAATRFGKLSNDAEITTWIDGTMAEVRKLVKAKVGEDVDKMIFDGLAIMRERPWAISLLSLEPPAEGHGEAVLDAAIVIDGGPKAGEVLKLVEDILEKAVPPAEAGKRKKIQIGLQMLNQYESNGKRPAITWGRVGDLVLVALGDKAPGAVAATIDGTGKSLATDPKFAEGVAKVGKGLLTVHYDFMTLMKAVTRQSRGREEQALKVILGLMESLEGYTFTIAPDGEDFVTRVHVRTPPDKSGLTRLFDQKPLRTDLLSVAPGDSTLVLAGNLDWLKLWAELETQLKKYPDIWGKFSEGLARGEETLSFKVRDDMLACLGDGLVMYNSPGAGGVLVTGLTLVMEVKDPAKLRLTMGRIETVLSAASTGRQHGNSDDNAAPPRPKVTFAEVEYKGSRIRYMQSRGIPNPVAPAYCVTDKYLVLSLWPQTTKAALDQIARGREGSILGDEQFKALMAKLPAGASFVGYTDDRQTMKMIYPLLPPLWQTISSVVRRKGVDLDPAWLPTQAALLRHVSGTAGVIVNQPDGLMMVGRGWLPGVSATVVVAEVGVAAAVAGGYWAFRQTARKMTRQMEAIPMAPNQDAPAPAPAPAPEEDF
ncbi:MAG: hypothetical protein BIFFINMI_04232 [Phycisphaerae bacterium]|nr:hypothetical protein [Phycisphaerae bacterium]